MFSSFCFYTQTQDPFQVKLCVQSELLTDVLFPRGYPAVPAPFVENMFFDTIEWPWQFCQMSAGRSCAVLPLGFLFHASF